ncbi:transcriptional regulator [Klebsiella michiganensis]|uniref:Transcriptional regulator n=1 Tax=Klebsiella michiganensis TaxID=1134687 RepID=A0A7H4N6L7_9ENTR|nr:transcriptional regulator [Klebsiella michiganensis]
MPGVSTHSLYIDARDAPRESERCEVLQVSPLTHQLLLAACQLPLLYDESGRDAALIALLLHELRRRRTAADVTPLPQNSHLAALCGDFQRQPSIRSTPQLWAQKLSKSVRTFNRLFRRETGMAVLRLAPAGMPDVRHDGAARGAFGYRSRAQSGL